MSLSDYCRRALELALGHSDAANELANAVDKVAALPQTQYTADASAVSYVSPAAEMAGAQNVTLNLTGALAAGRTVTTDTAANLFAAIPGAQAGQSYILNLVNSSSGAFSWTLAAGAGVTLNGTLTVAQNTWREFYVTFQSATACTMQSVGTGTNS